MGGGQSTLKQKRRKPLLLRVGEYPSDPVVSSALMAEVSKGIPKNPHNPCNQSWRADSLAVGMRGGGNICSRLCSKTCKVMGGMSCCQVKPKVTVVALTQEETHTTPENGLHRPYPQPLATGGGSIPKHHAIYAQYGLFWLYAKPIWSQNPHPE